MLDGSTSRFHHHIKRVHGLDAKVPITDNTPASPTSNILERVPESLDSSKGADYDNEGMSDNKDYKEPR